MSLKWSHLHLPNGAHNDRAALIIIGNTAGEKQGDNEAESESLQHEKARAFGALLLAITLWEASPPLTAVVCLFPRAKL